MLKKSFIILILGSQILLSQTNTFSSSVPFKPGDGIYIGTLPDTLSFFNRVIAIDDMGFAEFPIIGRVEVTKMSISELSEFSGFCVYRRMPPKKDKKAAPEPKKDEAKKDAPAPTAEGEAKPQKKAAGKKK